MIKQGIVIATDGGMATLEQFEKKKCDSCPKRTKVGACDGCPDYAENSSARIVAHNKIGAEVGDRVEYCRTFSEDLIFVFLVFGLPIICTILSYFITVLFIDDNSIKTRIALTVFGVATALACIYSYKHSKRRCDYSINRIIEAEDN